MAGKYKKILIITFLFNIIIFAYYLANSDINPSVDAFYYLALADSFHNGTGFANITTDPPQPIYTPQNGIVFIHVLLQAIGLHGAASRLLCIKLINYLGFLLLIYIFYKVFIQLKVSSELTFLSIGILLSGAHFFKTINEPLNEGMWCVLTAVVFYLAISNENKESYAKIAAIALSGIFLANFRLNGPVIILSIAVTYVLLNKINKSLIFFAIFVMSYASIYIILTIIKADCSGFQTFSSVYSYNFIFNRPLMSLVYTVPGVFLGITGSRYMTLFFTAPRESLAVTGKWLITLPFSLILFIFYGLYLRKYIKSKKFTNLLIIFYTILLLAVLQIMPGGDSRYIIMILPFTLLAIATYFDDSRKLRLFLGIILLLTISVSMYRLIWWDSIYFINNKSVVNLKNQMDEPYMLISKTSRQSYYIFGKASKDVKDISKGERSIVVFGDEKYIAQTIISVHNKLDIDHIEYLNDKIVAGRDPNEIYRTVRIIAK